MTVYLVIYREDGPYTRFGCLPGSVHSIHATPESADAECRKMNADPRQLPTKVTAWKVQD